MLSRFAALTLLPRRAVLALAARQLVLPAASFPSPLAAAFTTSFRTRQAVVLGEDVEVETVTKVKKAPGRPRKQKVEGEETAPKRKSATKSTTAKAAAKPKAAPKEKKVVPKSQCSPDYDVEEV